MVAGYFLNKMIYPNWNHNHSNIRTHPRYGFWQKRSLNSSANRSNFFSWQPYWISNWHENHKLSRGSSN